MNEIITEAKAEFTRAKERIAKALATTTDDKINWAPSPTARTIIQLVAHGAMGTKGIGEMIAGKPFQFSSLEEMDAALLDAESKFSTRQEVLALLEQTSSEYLAWLDTLSTEQLNSVAKLPFGEIPMKVAITIPADHLRGHAGQIDYVQTIYGDRSWHM